ncbi:MAG: HAMP domain-containing sensor histidine kinase [Oxalicibacterium faecigallinarum]|uniref:sensor histidine kinase n=1 Tax=Oxalicibacterium faecigallinarum TaxID=573741 RepID=UPI00280895B1|nr:HAMP domain-containing sensor histidine kinase [Oxalicibacterium faecigallinarum]MDQ7970081.1 HAMP domain-containing sensor histidine kinase [Oxalicibacterium faecigallinarum]
MDAQLTALIVHDLKNALGVLEGELSLLKDAPDQPRASRAHAQCVQLREKLVGFLTLYKEAEQGLLARVEAVSPDDFLRALLADRITDKPSIAITIDDRHMPDVAFFDEHLVGLALEAALQNASRFAQTHIELGCHGEHGAVVFSIRDDGPGLGTKETIPSTGLGMALCQAVARAHQNEGRQGTVSLANHPDGGALFRLTLP